MKEIRPGLKSVGGRTLRVLEFIEEDAGDPFKLATLVVEEMGEAFRIHLA